MSDAIAKRKRDDTLLQDEGDAGVRGDTPFPRGGGSSLTPLEIRQAAADATSDVFKQLKRPKREKKSKSKPAVSIGTKPEPLILSRLKVDTLVLGQITDLKFSSSELVVSLPNNLTGYCVFPALSATLVGRMLRFSVVQTTPRVMLSVDPDTVNVGLERSELVAGLAVQGFVTSVEEKGVLLDLGGMMGSGFVQNTAFSIGEPVLAFVAQPERRVIGLTLDTSAAARTAMSQASLLPGTLVRSAPLEHSTPLGRVYALLGQYTATSDAIHSEDAEQGVRVLFSFPPTQINGDRQLGVSNLPHILALKPAASPLKTGTVTLGEVTGVRPNLGLFMDVGTKAFAHIAQIPGHVGLEEAEEYAVGTKHRVRVISTPALDGTPQLSLDPKVMTQAYMSVEDVQIGDVVDAEIDRVLPKGGVLIKLGGVTGLAPNTQLSDTLSRNPEQRFKPGQKVKARVLDVDIEAGRVALSVRKSVVEFEGPLLQSYDVIEGTTLGVVTNVLKVGARVGFFGGVSGLLPVSEAGEAGTAAELFKVGQTVRVRVLEADEAVERLILTTKSDELAQFSGQTLNAKVVSKSKDVKVVVYHNDKVVGEATLLGGKAKVGAELKVKVLTTSLVTANPKLLAATLPSRLEDLVAGTAQTGFVKGRAAAGLFVGFGGGLVGLVPGALKTPPVGSPVDVLVDSVDLAKKRVYLSMSGERVKAVVTAVKATQLNVVTEDGRPGRVDASQAFASFAEIADPKQPLAQFKTGDSLDLAVVGRHDARNHRFLPLSHRTGASVMLELAKHAAPPLVPGKAVGFVNNYENGAVWLTLSPTVRAQMSLVDLSNDADVLADPEQHFPVGSALEVRVLRAGLRPAVTALTSSTPNETKPNEVGSTEVGSEEEVEEETTPVGLCQIHQVTPLRVMVRLPNHKTAAIAAIDAAPATQPLLKTYQPGDIVPFYTEHKHVVLRPPLAPVRAGDVRRGFVVNIKNGVFVALAPHVVGRAQIGQLSDAYLKDWTKFCKLGDAVEAKVLGTSPKIELSLKQSAVTGLKQPGLASIEVGKAYSGVVRRVETFGVFVDFKGVTGLCHRSEVSDRAVELEKVFAVGDKVRVKVLAKDGERLSLGMKAKYFASEASTNTSEASEASEDENASDNEESESDNEDSESELEVIKGDPQFDSESDANMDLDASDSDSDASDSESDDSPSASAISAGFDWSGALPATHDSSDSSDSDSDSEETPRRRKRSAAATRDETAAIQTRLPQSAQDFERLLLASPASSVLWTQYVAFQLQLGELDAARQLCRRALTAIPARDEAERLNMWVALLNVETQFGTPDSTARVFAEAQQHMDSQTVHLRMAAVYTQAGQIQNAREVYKRAHKRFGDDPAVWLAEARFLFSDAHDKPAARSLADTALQRLAARDSKDFTRQFALLEFELGDAERGRTLLEALLAASPRRVDLWNVFIDQELKLGEEKRAEQLFERVLQQKVSMKQAKFFFKKWIGVAADQEYVKRKAQEYIAERAESE